MRVVLLVVAHALLRAPDAPKAAPAPDAAKLAKITESLKKVQTGLSALPNPPSGLSGLLSEIDSTLVTLASDAVSDAEKLVSAGSVMHAIGEFKAMLTERQDQLEADSKASAAFQERGTTPLEEQLFKSLLSTQDLPMDAQLKIFNDPKYAELPILETVRGYSADQGDTMAVRLGLALDARDVEARKERDHPQSKTEKLAAIAKALEAREKRVETELSAADAKEKKREDQVEASAKLESKMGSAASKSMGTAEQALKFFNREAKHAFLKKEATMKKEAAALKAAVLAIHKGDVSKIQAALNELQSMGPGPAPLA